MKIEQITPEFVEYIPEVLKGGKLYISEKYKTAVHKCCCGCGEEVVTPLSPAEWSIKVHGDLVSLFPSIGNWSFKCRSHYWIRNNRVVWDKKFTKAQVERVRKKDQFDKARHIKEINLKKEKPSLIALMLKKFRSWF